MKSAAVVIPNETLPSRSRRYGGYAALLAPALLFYLLFFVVPHFYVLSSSVTPKKALSFVAYSSFFSDPTSLAILWRTVRLSFWTTLGTLALGYPIAVYLAQPWRKGRTIVTFAVIAPMLVSAVARSYGWIIILGSNGLLSRLIVSLDIHGPDHLLYTEPGLVIALTHVFLPFMTLAIAGSLQQIHPSLPRAARIHGASRTRTFLEVILPLSMPGVTAGAAIVFCLTASAFVTPALVGGTTIPMMSYVIYNDAIMLLDWPAAAAAAIILLVATAVITVAYTSWSGRFAVASAA
jgi:putative spermidine/putrescine transport system permease protein